MDIALITSGDDALPTEIAELMARVDLPLVTALEGRGARVHRPVWSDAEMDWSRFDLALVRTTWDYIERRDEFVAWAARAAEATRLVNPPEVLRWNSHKSYLLELEERGAPVVPTAWLGQGDRIALEDLLAVRSWKCAVIKPAVASGSRGMVRVAVDAELSSSGPSGAGLLALDAGQAHLDGLLGRGDVLVQPYLAAVTDRGELSVIVVDGEVSHAVRKVPPAGEYRVQETYGGRYTPETLAPEVSALARWIVDATGAELFIARVDLLEDETGAHQLVELEATEPDLYLGAHPAAAEHIAAAILRRAAA